MSQFEKAMLWTVKIGLWVLPLLPLYVSGSMLFPFITGKNFTFRIITEIIFALWVGLAVMKSEYRPRLTPLFKIVSIFVAIVFLADLLSPNPWRAFFSNYERMEGFMMLGHLYLYFLMLTSVFKTRRDWLIFFHISLAASLIASYYGLLQRLGYRVSIQGGFRVDATIGNPTYFAAYLLSKFSDKGETVMIAPATGFYATKGLGNDEIRIAYVLEEEKLERAIALLGLAITRYRQGK